MNPTPRRLSRSSFLPATAFRCAAAASGGSVSIVEAHRRLHDGKLGEIREVRKDFCDSHSHNDIKHYENLYEFI